MNERLSRLLDFLEDTLDAERRAAAPPPRNRRRMP
jgi:hypothetical protein